MNLLESEEGRNLRQKIYKSLVYIREDNEPYATEQFRACVYIADKGVSKIKLTLSPEEESSLNTAYVAYLRLRGKIDHPTTVKYNLIYNAIKWKIFNEFSTKEKIDSQT